MTKTLINNLSGLLASVAENDNKPLMQKPDNIVLSKILQAAQNYDINGLEEGIAELEKNSYTQGNDLVQKLRALCNSSDFLAIQEQLAKS